MEKESQKMPLFAHKCGMHHRQPDRVHPQVHSERYAQEFCDQTAKWKSERTDPPYRQHIVKAA